MSGPDAQRLVDRVITRDATKLAVGSVFYTPWCDENGKVVDDGTVHRLGEQLYRWTAADPQLRWLRQNSAGLDVDDQRRHRSPAALALQGPSPGTSSRRPAASRSRTSATSAAAVARIGKVAVDVSRTGYTGDLGYEVWIPADRAVTVWDSLMAAGEAYGIRPAGMLALDVVRLEAGLILLEVDYTSARHAMNPEQHYSPFEIGLGRLVDFDKGDFVGRLALERERRPGGPARRLVGLQLDWYDIEALYSAQGLPPAISPAVDRTPVPVFAGGPQVGRVTSHGWSPILKQAMGLASVPPRYEALGSKRPSSGPSKAGAGASARRWSSCRSWTCRASASDVRYAPPRSPGPDPVHLGRQPGKPGAAAPRSSSCPTPGTRLRGRPRGSRGGGDT